METKDRLSEFSTDELELELNRRKRTQLIPAELPESEQNWDNVRDVVRTGIKNLVDDGHEPKDFEHYLYEAVIETMFGEDVWESLNCL